VRDNLDRAANLRRNERWRKPIGCIGGGNSKARACDPHPWSALLFAALSGLRSNVGWPVSSIRDRGAPPVVRDLASRPRAAHRVSHCGNRESVVAASRLGTCLSDPFGAAHGHLRVSSTSDAYPPLGHHPPKERASSYLGRQGVAYQHATSPGSRTQCSAIDALALLKSSLFNLGGDIGSIKPEWPDRIVKRVIGAATCGRSASGQDGASSDTIADAHKWKEETAESIKGPGRLPHSADTGA